MLRLANVAGLLLVQLTIQLSLTLIDRGVDVSAVYDGESISFKEHVVLNEDLNKLFLV